MLKHLSASAWLLALLAGCSGMISGEVDGRLSIGDPSHPDHKKDGAIGVDSDGGGVGVDTDAAVACDPQTEDCGPVTGPVVDDDLLKSVAYGLWRDEVQPLIASECQQCHLGQRFAFASLHRAGADFTDDETLENYLTFFPMISLDNPPESRLLTKLLPAGAASAQQHGDGGASVITDSTHPTYQTILGWADAEQQRRCKGCGVSAASAYIAYLDQPDSHWAINRRPERSDFGFRHGAKIMLQPVNPVTGLPVADTAPIEFLPSSFCGASGACDFGRMAASYAGDKLAFECRFATDGTDWLDQSWNICVADIGADGKAVNPHFLRPAAERHTGWTIARADPYGLLDSVTGKPEYGVYDEHQRMRKMDDMFPVFWPDDSRLVMSSRSPDPRTGMVGTTTYHGGDHTGNIISLDLAGADSKTHYLNEGGTAEHPAFLRNGNLAFHTWNLERMDQHLYTQATQDGMMELPVLFGRVQGLNMWGSVTQLAGGGIIGITGRRRGSVEHFQAFFADHTLGTSIDPNYVSFKVLDLPLEAEMDSYMAYCNDPPDGINCSTARFYDDASYSPRGGALVAYNPNRTYYKATGFDDQQFQDAYGAAPQDFASMQAWLPEFQIAEIDKDGNVEVLITPAANRSLRYPTWVGPRQPPMLQPSQTDTTKPYADLHFADFPLWFEMRGTLDLDQTIDMQVLDTIVAARVMTKVLANNACTFDGKPMDRSVYQGDYGGTVDHSTHLGITNATGFVHYKVPVALGGDAYGNVPLQADKSVFLRVPAGELLLVQGVDADGHLVAQQDRLFTVPRGHVIDTSVKRVYYNSQCQSCHGSIDSSPYKPLDQVGTLPAVMDFDTAAKAAGPVDLMDPSVQHAKLTFMHALRPVLNAKCVSCHSGATPDGELTLEATYSQTANYPAGKWATPPYTIQSYLDHVPLADRVPGYNWSVARDYMLQRDLQRDAFIPAGTPFLPQGDLAPWDPAYQMLFLSDPASSQRFYFLSDTTYGKHVGRGGRYSDTSYLLEVLTGRDLSLHTYAGATDHTGILTEAEVRLIMALIDNGMPYMTTCSDKMIPAGPNAGPNAGKPWGEPNETAWP
jgi:hypothetical protein